MMISRAEANEIMLAQESNKCCKYSLYCPECGSGGVSINNHPGSSYQCFKNYRHSSWNPNKNNKNKNSYKCAHENMSNLVKMKIMKNIEEDNYRSCPDLDSSSHSFSNFKWYGYHDSDDLHRDDLYFDNLYEDSDDIFL